MHLDTLLQRMCRGHAHGQGKFSFKWFTLTDGDDRLHNLAFPMQMVKRNQNRYFAIATNVS